MPAETPEVAMSPFRKSLNRLRRRRSRSAPPGPRTPLITPRAGSFIQHHYQFDEERKEVLPGMLKYENDLEQESHDFFNLIVLIPMIVLNIMNWNWEKMFNLKKKETILDTWKGDWFDQLFYATALYLFVDLVWILIVPKCVKSQPTIIQHHIFTTAYILYFYFEPDKRWAVGAYMSAQINTWFLIARRVFNKEGFPPWIIDLSFVSIKIKLISVCFYVTWIGIRCILYPVLMVYLFKLWYIESHKKTKSFCNIAIIPPLLLATFCILNFKWTFDLIRSKFRYHKRKLIQRKGKATSQGI